MLLDIVLKAKIQTSLEPYESFSFTSFFHFTYVQNHGMSLSLFADNNGWQKGLSILMGFLVSIFFYFFFNRHNFNKISTSQMFFIILTFGGTWGNVFDILTE